MKISWQQARLEGCNLPDDLDERDREVERRLTELYRLGLWVYSPTGIACYTEALNSATHGARRALRRRRIAVARLTGAPMKIRVVCEASWSGDVMDVVEVYGWRAALTAIRAMRRLYADGYHLVTITVEDADFQDAFDHARECGAI